jgi:uncharacterized membrane protein YedE/YeeE
MEIVLFPLGVSAVVIAVRLFFCETTKNRVIACFLMPLVASLLSTAALCLFMFLNGTPPAAYNWYGISLFILPMSFVWSYMAIPTGIILSFLITIMAGAFTPYAPYKSDKKAKD